MFSKKRLLLLTLVASLAACDDSTGPDGDDDGNRIVGSGNVVSTTIPLESFHGVKARGVARVVIKPGIEETVTVTADDNLLPILWAQVEDGQLLIGTPDSGNYNSGNFSISTDNEILFEVTYRIIDDLDLSGVLQVDAEDVRADTLHVVLSGVSTFTIDGLVEHQVVSIDGVNSYLAADLDSRVAKITGNGVMEVELNVRDELFGNVCGAGSIKYLGTPAVYVTTCPAVTVSPL